MADANDVDIKKLQVTTELIVQLGSSHNTTPKEVSESFKAIYKAISEAVEENYPKN